MGRMSKDEIYVDLFDRVKQLESKNENLNLKIVVQESEIANKDLTIKKLQGDIEHYRKALDFYGHKDNYDKNLYEDDYEPPIYHDEGKRARLVLDLIS